MIKYFAGASFKSIKFVGAELAIENGTHWCGSFVLLDYGTLGLLYERLPKEGETDRIFIGGSLNANPMLGVSFVTIEGKEVSLWITLFGKDLFKVWGGKEVE